jgi:hypothetical protein
MFLGLAGPQKQKTHLPFLRRWVGYNPGVKRAYKTGSSPKQDTAAQAVICRRQQQAALVGMKLITI